MASPQTPPAPHVLVTPNGKRYLVTVTNEPGTEEALRREQQEELGKLTPLARAQISGDSEDFAGHDRRAAKTSIADAQVESFSTLDDLATTLIRDEVMRGKTPPISEAADSDRVSEEKRNVTVTAFIYAAKFETDHDYHLILGTDAPASSRRYLNVEVSGLPTSGPARAKLLEARTNFKNQFVNDPIGPNYHKFNPPIPVQVTGSLFFDMDHLGGAVGPSGMRPTTAWEIHPVTKIEF